MKGKLGMPTMYQIKFHRVGKERVLINFRDRIHAGNFLWRKITEAANGMPLSGVRDELRDWVTRELPGHFEVKTLTFVAEICEV